MTARAEYWSKLCAGGISNAIVDRLHNFADAWNRADVNELLAFMDPDCEFLTSRPDFDAECVFHGKTEVRRGFEMALEREVLGEIHDRDISAGVDFGVAEWTSMLRYPRNTVKLVRCYNVFRFDAGKIRKKAAFLIPA